MQSSVQQLEALARLANNPDGQQLLALLRNEQEVIDRQLRTAPMEKFQLLQGRAVCVGELIDVLTNARKYTTPKQRVAGVADFVA